MKLYFDFEILVYKFDKHLVVIKIIKINRYFKYIKPKESLKLFR